MYLAALFERCLNIGYNQVENGADYAIERIGTTLYIYFEHSDGITDWKNNIDFPAKPYKRMGRTVWLAHRGFMRVWKTVEDYIAADIMDPQIKEIVITGYSHGAGIAVLCHEYVWYHRRDLRDRLKGYGFGCPRVIWGCKNRECRKRWEQFMVIRNINDIITHLPPAIFGYSHVGEMLEIGERGRYSMTDAHRPENILAELRRMENASSQAVPSFVMGSNLRYF